MKPIKRVSVEELAAHAAEYLAGSEPIVVEQDGRVVGRYEPATNGHTANGTGAAHPGLGNRLDDSVAEGRRRTISRRSVEAAERLNQLLQQIYDRTGMTEDELADYFDMTKPYPFEDDPDS